MISLADAMLRIDAYEREQNAMGREIGRRHNIICSDLKNQELSGLNRTRALQNQIQLLKARSDRSERILEIVAAIVAVLLAIELLVFFLP